MKGLLVDDDELYARTLQRSLARKGIETEIALDAASALARAREYLPDFALVDLKLGSDSGLTLIEPLASSVLAFFVLQEIPSRGVLLGGLLILAGIYLASSQGIIRSPQRTALGERGEPF